ncbi:MAG: DNA repair protein RadC [Arenicella sp.]
MLVKKALEYNAGAIILAHNHPSGIPEPSRADISITKRIYEAMDLIEVKLLDHFVVSTEGVTSMAEQGLI